MLHWKHIKGFYRNSGTLLYTFIEFQEFDNTTKENNLPVIISRCENSESIETTSPTYYKNFGHIVTNGCDTTINGKFTFNNDVYIKNNYKLYFGDPSGDPNNSSYIQKWSGYSNNGLTISSNYINIISKNNGGVDCSGGKWTFGYDPSSSVAFEVRGESFFAKNVSFGNNITVDHACNAEYFNATSDIRAKEKIEPISQSMLDVVNKIQLYTFNYKDNPTERAIGLIAQEVQDVNLDGFELVANKNASGKEKDFMAIKESKLVYVLLGAVKELSAEVARLKEKLGE